MLEDNITSLHYIVHIVETDEGEYLPTNMSQFVNYIHIVEELGRGGEGYIDSGGYLQIKYNIDTVSMNK